MRGLKIRFSHVNTLPNPPAFTLVELLVVIAIISILSAILFPVFASARDRARQCACLSNTKQLGLAIAQYIQDYDETLPMGGYNEAEQIPVGTASGRWYDDVYPYINNVGVFVCPSQTTNLTGHAFVPTFRKASTSAAQSGPSSAGAYGCNANIIKWTAGTPLSAIGNVSGTFIIAEAAQCDANGDAIIGNLTYATNPLTWNQLATGATDFQITPPSSFKGNLATKTASAFYYSSDDIYHNYSRRPVGRHNGGLNIIYVDGHAKWQTIIGFLGVGTVGSNPGKVGWDYGDPRNTWDDQ